MKQKYSAQLVELFAETFRHLPLAHVLNSKVLVVHGGLFSQDGVKLDDIRAIDRNRYIGAEADQPMLCTQRPSAQCLTQQDVVKSRDADSTALQSSRHARHRCSSRPSACSCREPPEEGLMCELLWSDPQAEPGRSPSKRGVGVGFGESVTPAKLVVFLLSSTSCWCASCQALCLNAYARGRQVQM